MNKYQFEGMTPEEAHDVWKTIEKRFRTNTREYNKGLPADVRDGRGFERENIIAVPRGYIQEIAVHNTNYEVHAMQVNSLKKELLKEKITPKETAEIQAQIDSHNLVMEQALRNVALVLASWTIYDFVYFDFTREYKVGDEIRNSAYTTIKKAYRFDLFVAEVRNIANEFLESMGYPLSVESFGKGMLEQIDKGKAKK
jgi:hypothetical protein